MFQDIRPHEFHNQFTPREPQAGDYIIAYKNNQALFITSGEDSCLPQYEQMKEMIPDVDQELIYLLSVDDAAFYLTWKEPAEADWRDYHGIYTFREMMPDWLAFSGATAFHLARWYDSHRYCGHCAAKMEQSAAERALQCPACAQVEYPKISPVVMVAIQDGEDLLLTRYAHATYRRYALVAGFMEIGETLEDAVRREVMEEVGLKLKNLRYYKSQPWPFSDSVLVGFFADLDGSREIVLDENELAEAEWVRKADLPVEKNLMSLTWDMIQAFRLGAF